MACISFFLTYFGLCPTSIVDHRQHSTSTSDPGLSSSVSCTSDRFCTYPSCLGVPVPCVLRSSSLSLPLWILGQSLPSDVAGSLPEGVANSAPLSSVDLCPHWFLICCPPQVFIAYHLWPPDTENFAQTVVEENLELVEYCLSHSPCLDFCLDASKCISVMHSMMIDMTELYLMIPTWVTLIFTQGHRVPRKLELVNYSVVMWPKVSQTFEVVNFVRKVTAKEIL